MSLSPLLVAPKATGTGLPANYDLARPYDNLAVPGATSVDVVATTTGVFHEAILRGKGTQLQQAVSLAPTFVTVWIGSNDVLGAVTSGRAIDGVTMVPLASFRAAYAQILGALRATGATVVTATIPDVTLAPFANAIPPVVVNPATGQPVLIGGQTVPLIGPTGPLAPGSKVTLGASSLLAKGIGIPAALGGSGQPLPDEVVLDPAELAIIRDRVSAINASIREIAGGGGSPGPRPERVHDRPPHERTRVRGRHPDRVLPDRRPRGLRRHPPDRDGLRPHRQRVDRLPQPGDGHAVPAGGARLVRLRHRDASSSLAGATAAPGARARESWLAAPLSAFEFTQEAFDQLRSVFPDLSAR